MTACSTLEYQGLFNQQRMREELTNIESLDKLVTAEIESMRQALADELMLTLSQEVHLRLLDAGTVSTSDFLAVTARGGTLAVVTNGAGQHRHEGVYFSDSATGALLECVLWGSPAQAKPTDRELNELERRFLEPVVRTSARTIRETADETTNGEFGVEMMTGPRLRAIVDTDSSLAVMEYEIRISGSAPGSLLLFASCGSSSLVGRIGRPKTSTTQLVPSRTIPTQRRKLLGQIAVDVAVTLEGNRIRFSDLISLQLGDVIALESPLTEQLVGTANGAAVFSGTVSSHKGQRFYKIDSLLSVPRAISISSARATAGGRG